MRQDDELHAARRRIKTLYSAETVAAMAECWTGQLVAHFRRLSDPESPVLNWADPSAAVREADSYLVAPCSDEVASGAATSACDDVEAWLPEFTRLIQTMLARGHNLHHPRYIGHQVPASLPVAALFDAIGTVTNQVMAIYEMGPWATAVERAMIGRLGAEIGYAPKSFTGLITNGGSLANLTALLTARNVAVESAWRGGIEASRRATLVVQSDVHYCIVRAAGILGIGTDNVVRIPVDGQRKMRVDILDQTLARLTQEERTIVAVVAGACATPIGAFDPIDNIADVCERHQVWLHVDAAHGGAALLSDRHRHLLSGLSRADSVVWDAHKMLFVPALSAFTFYKDQSHRFVAFEQDAPYLFDPTNPGIAEYDSGTQTVECTKRALAFAVWGTWSLFGRELFRDLVDVTFELAQQFHQMLSAAPDFEPLHRPECNIQVFRYIPKKTAQWSDERLGEFQLELRRKVITDGRVYFAPIKLDGAGAMRATVMNPCTTPGDLEYLMDEIRRCAKSL